MKLVAQVKLVVDTEGVAWKVSDAYTLDKNTRRELRLDGAVTYDDQMLSWNLDARTVSIWTVSGRVAVLFVGGERQLQLLSSRKGESDLVLRDRMWFLSATCDEHEPEASFGGSVAGIDRGIANIASASNGMNFTGKGVHRVRHRNDALRARLQHKGTTSAKRLLKKRQRKEQRFATATNHKISYRLSVRLNAPDQVLPWKIYRPYETALQAIRDRTGVRKSQRPSHNSWSYYQLGQFMEYKTKRQGVPFTMECHSPWWTRTTPPSSVPVVAISHKRTYLTKEPSQQGPLSLQALWTCWSSRCCDVREYHFPGKAHIRAKPVEG